MDDSWSGIALLLLPVHTLWVSEVECENCCYRVRLLVSQRLQDTVNPYFYRGLAPDNVKASVELVSDDDKPADYVVEAFRNSQANCPRLFTLSLPFRPLRQMEGRSPSSKPIARSKATYLWRTMRRWKTEVGPCLVDSGPSCILVQCRRGLLRPVDCSCIIFIGLDPACLGP